MHFSLNLKNFVSFAKYNNRKKNVYATADTRSVVVVRVSDRSAHAPPPSCNSVPNVFNVFI